MPDATALLNEISGALDGISAQILGQISEDRTYMEMWGWNLPAIDRHDLASYVSKPKGLIQRIDARDINDADFQKLQKFPPRLQFIRDNVVVNLPGGNAFHVYIVVESIVEAISGILENYASAPFDVQALEDKKILPATQIRQLRRMDAAIQRLGVEASSLENKIELINSARDVAESLPADIQTLEDARARYAQSEKDLAATSERLRGSEVEMSAILTRLKEAEGEAKKVVERANEAYSAATTIGLGAAFSDRASSLSKSTIVLGVALVITLFVGALITYRRVEFVHGLMSRPNIDFNVLWLNVTFTALSVSAPVWLAWLLTRQIGQRFRLAEDYSYKATVAKAYEGYRAEAAHIDHELSKKLFGIALERLDEPPIRLVEKESPGSPVHEASSPLAEFFTGAISGKKGVDAAATPPA